MVHFTVENLARLANIRTHEDLAELNRDEIYFLTGYTRLSDVPEWQVRSLLKRDAPQDSEPLTGASSPSYIPPHSFSERERGYVHLERDRVIEMAAEMRRAEARERINREELFARLNYELHSFFRR